MRRFLNRTLAFVRRDFHVATSYKLQFGFRLLSGFFIIAVFYFISRLINEDASANSMKEYNTDFFSFVLIGVAATGLLYVGLSGYAEQLRIAMAEGSLEMMFASPIRPIWILVMPCLWNYFFETVRGLVIVLFGACIFGANLSRANVAACIPVVLLTLSAYSVFGLLSASIIMVIKRGDPINWAFANASALVSGAFFPVDLLPSWLERIAKLLPMTYSYHGMRMTLLSGGGLQAVQIDLAVLAGFSAAGLPLAAWVCAIAVAKAKKEGSLGSF